ncbi:hypothetical protein [Arthrobacter monumenti]
MSILYPIHDLDVFERTRCTQGNRAVCADSGAHRASLHMPKLPQGGYAARNNP